jgi:hypothetical protein
MKKSKLQSSYEYDFELLGLVSNAREHKLAWYLNQIPLFHFVKKQDIRIEFADNSSISISNFLSQNLHHQYTLLKNKLIISNQPKHKYVLPELSRFDYLLKFKVLVDDFDTDQLISSIKSIPVVEYVVKLELNKIKLKENLLYYH